MSSYASLFLNTVVLSGTTAQKLHAVHDAGFSQVELWRKDIDADEGGLASVADTLSQTALGLADYQVLLDFDGASPTTRNAKRHEAISLLNDAVALQARTLIVPANTRYDCVAKRVVDDLAWLANEAAQRDIRIAYEAMAWSQLHSDIPSAWRTIQHVDAPNIGLVIDAFHMFAKRRTIADLDGIPLDRFYLVQLSDLDRDVTPDTLVDTARHTRLLPGHGRFPLQSLIERLNDLDYTGPVGIEVFNDVLREMPPERVARSAMTALRQVLTLDRSGDDGIRK